MYSKGLMPPSFSPCPHCWFSLANLRPPPKCHKSTTLRFRNALRNNKIGTSKADRLKCLPPMRETQVRSLGREDPLEKEMATHSSILAWRIPWTEESGGLQSTGSQSRTRLSDFTYLKHTAPNSQRKLKLQMDHRKTPGNFQTSLSRRTWKSSTHRVAKQASRICL